jgi:hypothetical protein
LRADGARVGPSLRERERVLRLLDRHLLALLARGVRLFVCESATVACPAAAASIRASSAAAACACFSDTCA